MATHWATTGAAQGLGDGSSEANRIELKKAIENDVALASALAAGSIINCKDDGTLTFDGSLGAFATLALTGSGIAPIKCEGYTTTAGDGGSILIVDSDIGATNNCISYAGVHDYWQFVNVTMDNVRVGYDMGTTFGHVFINCAVLRTNPIAASANGWTQTAATGDHSIWIRCLAFSKRHGWLCDGRANKWVRCAAINCGHEGFQHSPAIHPGSFTECIAYSCGQDAGFRTASTSLFGCISIGNSGDGFWFLTADPVTMTNCVAGNNGGAGVDVSGGAALEVYAINCNLNPANNTNVSGKVTAGPVLYEIGNFEGDPLWADAAPTLPEDLDLTPGDGSSLLGGVGVQFHAHMTKLIDFQAVGAIDRAEPAGGGPGPRRWYAGILPITKTEDLV